MMNIDNTPILPRKMKTTTKTRMTTKKSKDKTSSQGSSKERAVKEWLETGSPQ